MPKNIGNIDKIIRLILGIAILVFGYFNQSWFALIGLVPLVTALTNFCPLYSLLGINTCRAK